jgi:hypothetical protein
LKNKFFQTELNDRDKIIKEQLIKIKDLENQNNVQKLKIKEQEEILAY